MKRLLIFCAALSIASLAYAQGPPAPYSVSLTWTVSASAGVTGQSVYRAAWPMPSGPCGTYTKLTVTPLSSAATTYSDASVTAGSAYCYYVTATGDTGESGPSNVASNVEIPPLPPTNLAVEVK